jgi:hypothetical protein
MEMVHWTQMTVAASAARKERHPSRGRRRWRDTLGADNGDDDATTPVIGVIGANSSLGAGDVLVAIDGNAISTICCGGSIAIHDSDLDAIGGSNLDVDALHVGGDDLGGMTIRRRLSLVADFFRRQRERLWHSWRHRPGRRQLPRHKQRHGQSWAGQRHPRYARLERERSVGPVSCVLKSSGSNIDTAGSGSGVFDKSVGDVRRSGPQATTVVR